MSPFFLFKHIVIPYYGLLNIQELPAELRIKSSLLHVPKRPSAGFFDLCWSLPPPACSLGFKHGAGVLPCQRCGSLCPLPLSQTSQSLLIPREALPEPHLISSLSQLPGTGGHLMALIIINHYLFLCVYMFIIHLLPLDPDLWGGREGRGIFSTSLKSQEVWVGLFLDKRDYKGETC